MPKPAELVQVKVRIPHGLRQAVIKRAEKSGRSFAGELAAVIKLALEIDDWANIRANMRETLERIEQQSAETTRLLQTALRMREAAARVLDKEQQRALIEEMRKMSVTDNSN
jgi:hypothetical protein